MRILLVAPGSLHSTYDVYRGYWDAMEQDDEVTVYPFNYHSILMYHKAGVEKFHPDMNEEDVYAITASRAARELLAEYAANLPDAAFVVSGIGIPTDIWNHVVQLQMNLKYPCYNGFYHTESPYLDNMQQIYNQYSDIVFLNDKYSLKTFDPDNNKHVYYLPHSYNPKVHYPSVSRAFEYGKTIDNIPVVSDLFFCGTAFAERVELIKSVNWTDVNAIIMGRWQHYMKPTDNGYDKIVNTEVVGNMYLAEFYRNTKIALNIHRTRPDLDINGKEIDNYSDAYSIGPRIYEAAACGALIISDFRQELVDVFGDTIEVFHDAEELNHLIRFWSAPENEERRLNKTEAAMKRIEHCTFYERFQRIVKPVYASILEGESYGEGNRA